MNKPELKFKDKKFKIMLMADPHEKYDLIEENGAERSADFVNLITTAANTLKPDLAVFLGDNVYGDTEEQYRETAKRLMTPFEKLNIPVSLVFGNHDHDHSDKVDLKTQLRIFSEYNNFLTFNADDSISGCGNCNLTVKSSYGGKDIYNLWFIDSNNLCDDKSISKYDWVHTDQIEWYKKTAKELADKNGGNVLPALLFQHTPVPEEYELLRPARFYEYFDSVPGEISSYPKRYCLKKGVKGYLGEGPCSPAYNNGEFAAWKEVGDVRGAFFGHDHMNDFCGFVDGIMLAQSKLVGFRQYTDGCAGGVRLITLDENDLNKIDTRMYTFKKDFGLKSEALGFYQRHVSDRQDIKLKAAAYSLGTAAAVTLAAAGIKALIKR